MFHDKSINIVNSEWDISYIFASDLSFIKL